MTIFRKNYIQSCHQALAYHPLQNSTCVQFEKIKEKFDKKDNKLNNTHLESPSSFDIP
jgi:hypothetical protein